MKRLRVRFLRWRTMRAWRLAGRAIDRANRLMDALWGTSDTTYPGPPSGDWLPVLLDAPGSEDKP